MFVPWNGIPSCFLFCGMVQIGIPRVCFIFCSMVQNSAHFSLPQNGSERKSESCFYFCSTVQNSEHFSLWNVISRVFCSAEQPEFRRNIRNSAGTAGITPEFRWNKPIFPSTLPGKNFLCRKLPTLPVNWCRTSL